MEKYPKLFIITAISYLLLAVILGVGFTVGYADPAVSRFIHIHLGLLGFMAMFIYGVAYHILPRFNAKPLAYPALVPLHFYLVNFGLIGMGVFAYAGGLYGDGLVGTGFVISAGAEAFGIFIFAFNVIPVMLPIAPLKFHPTPTPSPTPKPEPEKKPAVTSSVNIITPEMKVSRVLDDYPQLLDVFVNNSFRALANPVARATFAKAVTIERACKLHKVDMKTFIAKLNGALEGGGSVAPPKKPEPEAPQQKAEAAATTGKTIKRGEYATAETLVGSLLETYVEVKPVFEKHYGSGCFSCPGQAFETIGQTATMHSIEAEIILGEINEKIKNALEGAK